jgi:hypothetical protein
MNNLFNVTRIVWRTRVTWPLMRLIAESADVWSRKMAYNGRITIDDYNYSNNYYSALFCADCQGFCAASPSRQPETAFKPTEHGGHFVEIMQITFNYHTSCSFEWRWFFYAKLPRFGTIIELTEFYLELN